MILREAATILNAGDDVSNIFWDSMSSSFRKDHRRKDHIRKLESSQDTL